MGSFNLFIKKHKVDFIILLIIVFSCLIGSLSFYLPRMFDNENNNTAFVYLKDEVIYQFDLDNENKEREFLIHGSNGSMVLGLRKNEICVKESSCPHKYCVNQGYINSSSSFPIVCSYNQISIYVSSSSFEVKV